MKIVYFTHSLQSCWNHGNAHFLRGVLRELVALGHHVRALEPQGARSQRGDRRRDGLGGRHEMSDQAGRTTVGGRGEAHEARAGEIVGVGIVGGWGGRPVARGIRVGTRAGRAHQTEQHLLQPHVDVHEHVADRPAVAAAARN